MRHLVEHPQRLITKDDLLAAVWRDTIVSDAALASCIRDLRRALRESSRTPRYIETVHRRGFRFVGPIAGRMPALASGSSAGHPRAANVTPQATLVGRDRELALLGSRLQRALNGRRQLVFVTGEPGIGKTALVEAFLAQFVASDRPRIGRGQCVEQYGAGEAYLPVFEALGRLLRADQSGRLVALLKRHAPTWLAQMPALLSDDELEARSTPRPGRDHRSHVARDRGGVRRDQRRPAAAFGARRSALERLRHDRPARHGGPSP